MPLLFCFDGCFVKSALKAQRIANKVTNLSLCLVAVPALLVPHANTNDVVSTIIKSAITKTRFVSLFLLRNLIIVQITVRKYMELNRKAITSAIPRHIQGTGDRKKKKSLSGVKIITLNGLLLFPTYCAYDEAPEVFVFAISSRESKLLNLLVRCPPLRFIIMMARDEIKTVRITFIAVILI